MYDKNHTSYDKIFSFILPFFVYTHKKQPSF